jgi:bifunctional N-acetylglucosamine-1-phosphate-uridyltransferase/glucosamine-1-phosphate-acetyltransferase GlmU-like protein
MNSCFIILAGGESKRFNSNTPKPYINYKGKPLLFHSIDKAKLFNKFNKNDTFKISTYKTSKYRLTYGLTYKSEQVGKFRVFYRRENNIIEKQPKNLNILGLNYVYSIN